MKKPHDDIVCFYKDRCVSYPWKCKNCRHNIGKIDAFEPISRKPSRKKT